VLGLERVGIHDNFFDLGGHSLLLAKVHSQFQAALGRELAMIDLFRYPTISALAKYLNNAPEEDSLKESANRAERRRSAMQQQQLRMQSIAETRTGAPPRS
jgi:acyl carrier protein